MTSAKKIVANRRNSKKSTGPRSEAGKARSSRNSLKHGLTAKQVVLWYQDPAVYEALHSDIFEYYQPANPVAEHLADVLVSGIWRFRKVPEIEAAIYERGYHDLQEEVSNGTWLKDYIERGPPTDEEKAQAQAPEVEFNPGIGEVFERSQRSLTSLFRISGKIEASIYRAYRELECIKAKRENARTDDPVIDAEAAEVIEMPGSDGTKRAQARRKSDTAKAAEAIEGTEANTAERAPACPKAGADQIENAKACQESKTLDPATAGEGLVVNQIGTAPKPPENRKRPRLRRRD